MGNTRNRAKTKSRTPPNTKKAATARKKQREVSRAPEDTEAAAPSTEDASALDGTSMDLSGFSSEDPDAEVDQLRSSPTPPPSTKHQPPKHRPRHSIEVEEDGTSTDEPEPEIVLVIPCPTAREGVSQRLAVRASSSYSSVLLKIYDVLGCRDVKRKPKLTYKLSNAKKNSAAFTLDSAADWQMLVKDVDAAEKKKKGREQVPVDVFLTDDYLASLRAHLGKGKGKGGGKATKSTKKGPSIFSLTVSSDDEYAEGAIDGGDDEEGMDEEEEKWRKALEAELRRCSLCGDKKLCKIDKHGQHMELSHQKIRSWSEALARKTHGVTLKVPPKTPQFTQYHRSTQSEKMDTPVTPLPARDLPPPGYGYMPPWTPYAPPPIGYDPFLYHRHQPYASPSPRRERSRRVDPDDLDDDSEPVLPSSDLPEPDLDEMYPTIRDFIAEFTGTEHERRNLGAYVNEMELQDFVRINELDDLPAEDMVHIFKMTIGNARFLKKKISGRIELIDRQKKKEKKAAKRTREDDRGGEGVKRRRTD